MTQRPSTGPESIGSLLGPRAPQPKGPAHPWQDLALRIITELGVPSFKRSAVFRICRDYPEHYVLRALNDTKELCQAGVKWKYFFKVIEANVEWEDAQPS